MTGRDELIVFLKLPDPGRVKTRLIPAIGAAGAAALHRALVERTLARVALRLAPWTTILCFDPPDGAPALRDWLGAGFEMRAQVPGDLGARLESASAGAFAAGARRVAFIGTDAPDLGAGDIIAAFAALETADIAIAPALDGGYALLAARAHFPELFRGVPWSTADTIARTLDRARSAGLAVAMLRALADVDRPEDLAALPVELRPDYPVRPDS